MLIGAAGLAVDVARWYLTRRIVQTGIDAAALSLAGQGLGPAHAWLRRSAE